MDNDPNELDTLTTAHFLVGGILFLPPDPDILQDVSGSLRRWKHFQYLLQLFW